MQADKGTGAIYSVSFDPVVSMSGLKFSLLGMGNPLLDVIATVDQEFLDKYKVDPVPSVLCLRAVSRLLTDWRTDRSR